MTQTEDLQGYRDGLEQGELRAQCCDACGAHQWPPRPACRRCRGFGLTWVPLPPTATLFTWTVVARTQLPGFADKVPYAVGVLEYDELRIRLVGRLDADPGSLRVGDRLGWTVEQAGDGGLQPLWRPADGGDPR